MRITLILLALLPVALGQLIIETLPRPSVKQFSVVKGTCDESTGIISGASYTGRQGTLLKCSQACLNRTSCVGFNFYADQNKCQLFSTECGSTRDSSSSATLPVKNYYVRGEIACSTSTQGNEYYVAFMSNRVAQPRNPDLELWVTQDSSTDDIYATLQSKNPSLPLNAKPSSKIRIPNKQAVKASIPYTWKMKDGDWLVSVEKKGLKLSSDTDFVFYGVNKEYYTTDAFLGIPSRTLGTRYIATCHWPPNYNCEFAITPTDNATTVTITLPKKGVTRNVENWPSSGNGRPVGNETCRVSWRGRNYTNGQTFTVVLNEFEVVQVQDPCDLTGTLITSDKQIAVWSGDSRTNVGTSDSRDHLVEQLFPIVNWGYDCAAWPTPNRLENNLYDYWLITASTDGTNVKVDSNLADSKMYTLQAGESIRYPASSINEWSRISSTKPIQVIQTSSSAKNENFPGDPSTTICIPSVQFGYGYTFVTPSGVATTYVNYLTIIAQKGTESGFLIDQNPVTGVRWTDIPNSDPALVGGFFNLTRYNPSKQQFRIEHKTRGTTFEAYIYGSGDRESYGYPTGSCIKAVGVCGRSTMFIADGKDNDCDGIIDEELLDGVDNDFDGLIDEDCYAKKPCDCCVVVLCPDIPKIQNGYMIASSVKPGSTVAYKCLGNKKLVGKSTIVCRQDGTWSDYAPTCEDPSFVLPTDYQAGNGDGNGRSGTLGGRTGATDSDDGDDDDDDGDDVFNVTPGNQDSIFDPDFGNGNSNNDDDNNNNGYNNLPNGPISDLYE